MSGLRETKKDRKKNLVTNQKSSSQQKKLPTKKVASNHRHIAFLVCGRIP